MPNNTIFIAAIVFLCCSNNVMSEPLGIGDAKMGMALESVMKRGASKCKERGMIYKDLECNENLHFRYIPVKTTYFFHPKILTKIKFEFDDIWYADMLIILLEKYGTPIIQTAFEDSYSQLMWDLPEGVVKLVNNDKPKASFVQIISRDEVERFERFRQTWK